ncbi:HNH/endonuclease VII fold putative polymorphic toxin [Bradyrhizobium sp.]
MTIREHSLGHAKGDLGPHFNVEVRSVGGGPRQPLVGGADEHVFFDLP